MNERKLRTTPDADASPCYQKQPSQAVHSRLHRANDCSFSIIPHQDSLKAGNLLERSIIAMTSALLGRLIHRYDINKPERQIQLIFCLQNIRRYTGIKDLLKINELLDKLIHNASQANCLLSIEHCSGTVIYCALTGAPCEINDYSRAITTKNQESQFVITHDFEECVMLPANSSLPRFKNDNMKYDHICTVDLVKQFLAHD